MYHIFRHIPHEGWRHVAEIRFEPTARDLFVALSCQGMLTHALADDQNPDYVIAKSCPGNSVANITWPARSE